MRRGKEGERGDGREERRGRPRVGSYPMFEILKNSLLHKWWRLLTEHSAVFIRRYLMITVTLSSPFLRTGVLRL